MHVWAKHLLRVVNIPVASFNSDMGSLLFLTFFTIATPLLPAATAAMLTHDLCL